MTFDRRSRVLIADADPGLRRNLYQRLLDSEVLADTVPDGKAALETLSATPYAVVILDLSLPGVAAERILDTIAAIPVRVRPVVLVLADARVARSLDVDVVQIVLRKPCDLGQLSAIVQSCVRSAAASLRGDATLPSDPGEAVPDVSPSV